MKIITNTQIHNNLCTYWIFECITVFLFKKATTFLDFIIFYVIKFRKLHTISYQFISIIITTNDTQMRTKNFLTILLLGEKKNNVTNRRVNFEIL